MSCVAFLPTRCALAALCLGLFATAAAAQDPNAIVAQAAARDWLALTDRGDAQASWDAAGKQFQTIVPLESWSKALNKERTALGPTTSRAISKTSFQTTFPGAPAGDYVVIAYVSSFAHDSAARETVTLEHEGDGKWRVVGYDIH